MLGLSSVPLTSHVLPLANMGYVQPFFHIQNKLNRVIESSLFPKPASRDQHFSAVPYSVNAFVPANSPWGTSLDQQRYDRVLFYDLPGRSWSQNKRSIHPGSWFARNIIPYQQNLLRPRLQLLHMKYASQDQGVGMVSSTSIVGREQSDTYNDTLLSMAKWSPFVGKDTLLETATGLVHKDLNDETSTQGQVLNKKPLNSFNRKNKSIILNITSKEDGNGSTGKKSSKSDLAIHSPNPNGRGRSASVMSEISSTLSFEIKEAEIVKDPMFLSSSSQRSPSDETIESSVCLTPASQKAVSDVVPTLDFIVNSQSLPVFNSESTERSSPKLQSMGVTMPESSSKPIISKPLHFIFEPTINENSWHVVSRKKREHILPELKKPQNSSPLILPEHIVPNCSKTSRKCRKRKKKKQT